MRNLEDFIFNQAKSAIRGITPPELSDIYVFSFYVSDIDDDPRHPSLIIGYNTRTNFTNMIKDVASNEAKWDYAFWLQNKLAEVGLDDESHDLIEEWIEHKGLDYTDADADDCTNCADKDKKIAIAFTNALIAIVQRLHKAHITDLAILIHELDYDDDIKNQNILANGKERVKEFTTWIDNEMS